MPWSAPSVSELRTALIHAVRVTKRTVTDVGRGFSRTTASKWLARHNAD